jgi:hypothetical protein
MPLLTRTYNHEIDQRIVVLEYQLSSNAQVRKIMMTVAEAEFMIVGLKAAYSRARQPKAADPE